jgi:hypothetical protein
MSERDVLSRNIFNALLNFVDCIEKSNFFVVDKGALAFRLKPDFMDFYDSLNSGYRSSFPGDTPYGVFFFYRRHAAGFQVRFSEIARGGWRTVIPRIVANELERSDYYEAARDEFFREVFVLAHTQHSKNKDIFEGGSKMITLLKTEYPNDWHSELWEAQKAIYAAFLSLINYDETGALREKRIIDHLGTREIVEIGPDENMFDAMIGYMGDYGARAGYTLGSGIISGKPECGINHKEYGVTSFGVHQYFLRTMQECAQFLAAGLVKNLFGGAHFFNDTICHIYYHIRYGFCKLHFMGNHNHGVAPIFQVSDNTEHFAGQLRIQCGGGFVKAQYFRIQRQRTGNGHPLLLTAGKLVRVGICLLGKTHLLQQIQAVLFDLVGAAFFQQGGCQRDVFQHRILGK